MTSLSGSGDLFAANGDITICFETFGSANDPTILLINGVTEQMIAWPDSFCQLLAAEGRQVIRFDNRDVGRTTRVDGPPPTSLVQMLTGRNAVYDLGDMADDAVAVLDHLGVTTADVVGLSMGGMVAQEVALRSPDRVRTLSVLSSTPGSFNHGRPTWLSLTAPASRAGRRALFIPAPREREAFIEHIVTSKAATGATLDADDDADIRQIAATSFERGISRAGYARQFAAISSSRDRRRLLGQVRVPTLVLHGDADPIFPLRHARATAAAVPGARLEVMPGIGHGIPRSVWTRYCDLLCRQVA